MSSSTEYQESAEDGIAANRQDEGKEDPMEAFADTGLLNGHINGACHSNWNGEKVLGGMGQAGVTIFNKHPEFSCKVCPLEVLTPRGVWMKSHSLLLQV